MPYVRCVHCGLTTFNRSAKSVWMVPGECPHCRGVLSESRRPRDVEVAVRRRLYGSPPAAVQRVERGP